MSDTVAARIDRLAAEFAELAPRERLELLLEFAESLPRLPSEYQARRNAGEHRVPECQTPVFIWAEVADNRVRLIADVAPEAPTVKGFVGILAQLFADAPVEEVLAAEPNLIARFALAESLGMVRLRGLAGVQQAVRREVLSASAAKN